MLRPYFTSMGLQLGVFECLLQAPKLPLANWSSMADDAITQGSIGGLGSDFPSTSMIGSY